MNRSLKVDYHAAIDEPAECVTTLIDFLHFNPTEGQINQAAAFILPPGKVIHEKRILRWKYLLSLPYRAYRRFFVKG